MCGIDETVPPNLETHLADELSFSMEKQVADWLEAMAARGMDIRRWEIACDPVKMERVESDDKDNLTFRVTGRIRLLPAYFERKRKEFGITTPEEDMCELLLKIVDDLESLELDSNAQYCVRNEEEYDADTRKKCEGYRQRIKEYFGEIK